MQQTNYHLHLTGFVGGYDFDRQYVEYVLNENKGKTVNVLIDSLGGSLATALSIASAFHQHGDVNVHFVGMNASAATIASLGAKYISMDASAMYLAHKCSAEFFQWGSLNADQLESLQADIEQMKTDLEKMDANVAQMYAAKCGKKEKCAAEILDLMKVGGWLTAQEALDWGFVDELTHWEEAAPVLTDKVASAMASAGMPIPNLPIDAKEQAPFAKFLAALTSFFSSHNNTMPTAQNNPSLEEQITALQSQLKEREDSIAAMQKAIQAKEDAIAQHEKSVADLNSEIAALKSEVEALRKQPAADTTHVVENGGQHVGAKSETEAYIDTIASARSLFESLP